MIFKLSYNNQTHLYNKSLSIQSITNYCQKVFRDLPHSFTFIYSSPKGQMTYVESDADLIGLKYCCSSSNDMIVKLTIMKNIRHEQFGLDDDFETINIVRDNLQEMTQNIFMKLQDESHSEAVSEYLSQSYQKIATQIAQAQQNILRKQVRQYLSNLYERSARCVAEAEHTFIVEKTKKRKTVRFSPERPRICKSQKTIDERVSEKVLQLIPSLVDKIYAKLESKMNNKCKNCIRKQMDIEMCIEEQINRKLSSISIKDDQNPQE